MSKELAEFLVAIIGEYYSEYYPDDFSKYEYQVLENNFMLGRFEEIEEYLNKKFYKK